MRVLSISLTIALEYSLDDNVVGASVGAAGAAAAADDDAN